MLPMQRAPAAGAPHAAAGALQLRSQESPLMQMPMPMPMRAMTQRSAAKQSAQPPLSLQRRS